MGLVAGWFIERSIPPATYDCSSPPVSWAATRPSRPFSLDAVLLWDRHEHLLAALYVGGSVAGAIAGLVFGLWIVKTMLA